MSDLTLIGIVVLGAVGCIAWLFLKWIEGMLSKQKQQLAQQASTTLADMFIFLDPQKMFRYNVLAMGVLPGCVFFLTANRCRRAWPRPRQW